MIRYLMWSIFVLLTLGTIEFSVKYDDGLHIQHRSWLEDLIEKVQKK